MPIIELRLDKAYESASLIRSCADGQYGIDEIDWNDDRVRGCLAKYSKVTLLHYYIFANISVYESRYFRKDIDDASQLDTAAKQFVAYNIPFASFVHSTSDENDRYYSWFLQNEEAFSSLWEAVTDEVFQLLFRDRSFLLQFNLQVAAYLQSDAVDLPASMIAENGFLKRDPYFPKWLRRGIFHRDQGICVLCQRDLTSMFHTESQVHFDHMVPLASWGFNDPCNLQLLCQNCNLSKSGTKSITSAKYVPFWSE